MLSLFGFWLCVTLWTVAHQASLSMRLSRKEEVVMPFSRGSSWPRDWTHVSYIVGRIFTDEPTVGREMKIMYNQVKEKKKEYCGRVNAVFNIEHLVFEFNNLINVYDI